MIGDLFNRVKAQQKKAAAVDQQVDSEDEPWAIIPDLFRTIPKVKETMITPNMWLGPSTISGMCPRAFVISAAIGLPMIREETLQQRWTMDRGTVIHELLQDMWMGRSGMLLGGWKCEDCGHIHGIDVEDDTPIGSGHKGSEEITDKVTLKSAIPMPHECEKCDMKRRWRHGFSYVEPMVYNLELRISGYVDGIIKVPRQDRLELIDIKGTSKKALAKLRKRNSYLEHIVQVNWYLDMMGLPRGRVIYVARDEEDVTKAFLEKPLGLDEKLMAEEKEKIRGLRKEITKEKPSIPDCPHGGHRPWGPCECSGIEIAG